MRIVFFGTGQAVPEPYKKFCCTMVEVGGKRYFIDMGCQVIEQLSTMGISLQTIKGIFVTHMHGDHTNGLISLLHLCSWYHRNLAFNIFLPGSVEAAGKAIDTWLKCNCLSEGVSGGSYNFLPVAEGPLYRDEDIRVTAYRTQHNERFYAYLVEAEGKRILFTGDPEHPRTDFPVSALDEVLDLAVCESAHFGPDAHFPVFKGNQNLKKVCFTHYQNYRLASIGEMEEKLPGITVLHTNDGMEIM